MQIYSLSLRPKRPSQRGTQTAPDSILRLVDLNSGSEVARVKTDFYPYNAQFLSGTHDVFFSDRNEAGLTVHKLWNPDTGGLTLRGRVEQLNLKTGESFSSAMSVVDNRRVLGTIWNRDQGDILVSLSLDDNRLERIGPLSPSDNSLKLAEKAVAISPSISQIALGIKGGGVIFRRATDFRFLKQINKVPGLILGDRPVYTPDGKFLMLIASNTVGDRPETKRYFLFFDTSTYEIVRQLDITDWYPPNLDERAFQDSASLGTAMAVSPDSSSIAIAFTCQEKRASPVKERAEVVVYDLSSGDEIGKVSHQAVAIKSDDPFVAKIHKLVFTSNGNYLISSTYDTLVWKSQASN